ncbi:PREDICTED: multidrug resistance-associated protein 5-like [Priapulus caudatus]|uniref:Multidrug resistance-associated protein 5-like n=1 Tax=Priapulus caudatus TaxID=37621 RepID=A0ABM1DZN4_PRICU|nr:PREDICTED: multidrug resistance-associated protein 5-like [Priapulus caudatus]
MPSKSKKSSGGKLGKGEDFTEIPLNDIVVKTGNVSALDDDVPYLQDRIEGLPDGLQAYKPRSGLRKYKKTAKSFIPYRKKTKNVECARIDSAGCFSVITYSWLSALIYRMWKSNDVKQSDLYTCSIYDNTNSNTVRLEHRWNGEVARVGPQKASLARAVWAFCRTRILVGQAFFILCCIVGFFGPAIFVRKILEYAETKGMNSTVGRGITLVVGLTACEVVRSLMFAATWAVNLRTGARIRAGILGLVFEKILRLRTLGDKSAGEFVNLFANDGIRIFEGVTLGPLVVGGPLVVMMGLAYVVWLLGGWGAIGMLVFVFFYFIQMIIAKIAVYLRRKSIVATDKRVRLMTEVLTYVKLIKMYAWERSFAKAVSGLRVTERNWLQRAAYLQSMAVGLTPIVPMAAAVVTFISHTLSGNDLTVSQAFTVVAVYNTMRFSISILIYSARCSAEMIVSFRRIKTILLMEEVTHKVVKPSKPELALEIKNATFSWDAPTSVGPSSVANCEANGKASGGKSPNKEKYGKAKSKKGAPVDVVDEEEEELQQAATMEVKQVEALQNIDLQVEKGRLIGICGSVGSGKSSLLSAVLGQMRMNDGTLGIDGRFAYVAQQAWIINASVRENITFGADFDSKRYYEAIYASCLNTDIAMLANGDETEVGERGVNLSGGQKQRISLARAFYTNSDIYLLDDPLSSVDTRVGQHIFKHLIRGSLKGKTIRKLMTEEESGTGSVKWVTYKSYIAAAGGCCVLFGVVTLFLIVVCTIGFSNIWLSYWLRAGSGGVNMTREVTDGNMTYEETYVSESIMDNPRVGFYQLVYGLSIIAMVTTACFRSVIFMKVSLIASSRLHDMLFIKVLRSPMRFFDSTPVGRIINRFSTDMDEIDVRLPYLSEMALITLLFIFTALFLIAAVFPWFLIGVIPLCLAFSIVMKCFQTSIRQLKRLENLTRSPLFSHVTSSVQGLATIHAYNKARDTITKFNSLLDDHTTTYFLFHCAARWLAVRLDVITLSATVTTALLCVLMVGDQGAAWSGLALTYAMTLSGMFQFTIRLLSEAESRFTCVERIHHYIQHLESESSTEVELLNHAEKSWPQNGSIRFQKVCLKYREGLPLVLKDLTLEIKAGEKIGICGRTGAGKSSLGTALFRLVELESGYISIDTVDISKVGLEDLRSRIAIIPQDPVLFAGTIRYNLDPFNSSDDESLWAALEKTHMKENIKNLELQLNAPVIENGENFSVGERQLVCMARALLRNNKVAVSYISCQMFVHSHMNLSVAEFDTPQTLLADKKSLFSSMVASADQQMRAQLPSSQISVSR